MAFETRSSFVGGAAAPTTVCLSPMNDCGWFLVPNRRTQDAAHCEGGQALSVPGDSNAGQFCTQSIRLQSAVFITADVVCCRGGGELMW